MNISEGKSPSFTSIETPWHSATYVRFSFGIMATTADYAYEEARDGLAEAIRGVQPKCAPREVARDILSYDVPDHSHVIGLSLSGSVYLYHCNDRYVISVSIDRDGLSNGGPIRANWDDGSPNISRWAWKRRDWWKWVHPRYRW